LIEETMARPVEFDRAEALDAAMKLFWCQGYMATSVNQLLEAMEVGRSSFYAAFGDKRSLFIEVLELFSERTRKLLVDAWEEQRSLDAIRSFFAQTLLVVPRHRAGRGCLMVNTILELSEVDAELSALAARELGRIEAVFESCFAHCQQQGEYPGNRSASELAAHVMLLNQGLRVASRKRVSRRELEHQVDLALSLLGLPGAP
jgi:TetR/AcrR family transcriptional regulator, transcriptional repressor for nem operon